MRVRRFVCASLVGACGFSPVLAQSDLMQPDRSFAGSPFRSSLSSRLTEGFTGAFRPFDLSLVGLAALNFYKPGEPDDQIAMRPLRFDRSVTSSLGRLDGGLSLGSRVSPVIIQATIFFGQLGVMALLDLTTDTEINAHDYERPFVFAKTMLYTYGITEVSKNLIYRVRPDGSDSRAFFSGHTSGSFAASAFIYRELDDWIDGWGIARRSDLTRTLLKSTAFAATYGWATYVGYSRIHDRKHYLSDVIVGAAVGTVIGNLMYDWHFGEDDRSSPSGVRFSFIPSTQPAVCLAYHF